MAVSIAKDVPIFLCRNVMCRLCGCTGNNTSYLLLKETCYLIKIIKEETQVQIKEDDVLPKTVCRLCIDKIHMIQHFRAHCKKTQKVLSTMTKSDADTTGDIHVNTEQNIHPRTAVRNVLETTSTDEEHADMLEEWLDDEFDEQDADDFVLATGEDHLITKKDSYVVMYSDPNTFRNIQVSVKQAQLPKEARVIPSKVLGHRKRNRVKIVTKNELNGCVAQQPFVDVANGNTANTETSSLMAIDECLDGNMYVNICQGSVELPILFRILHENNKSEDVNVKNEKVEQASECSSAKADGLRNDDGGGNDKHESENDIRIDRAGRIFRSSAHKYVQKVSNKKYRCVICDKPFRYQFKAEIHIRRHIGEKPFLCKDCGKSFVSGFAVMKHGKTHRKGQFICEVCGKDYKEEYLLKDHQNVHRDGPPSFTCQHCTKPFHTRAAYLNHKLIHAAKNHICEVCGKRFALRSTMMRHMVRHSIPDYPCVRCPKVLRSQLEHRQHLKRHERTGLHHCYLCFLSFVTAKGLYQHNRLAHKCD